MPLSGVLSEYGFAGGWPSIFYVFGAIGTLWSVAFLWLVHEDPESHPTIPHDERKYIISSVWGAAGVSVSVFHAVTRARRSYIGTQYDNNDQTNPRFITGYRMMNNGFNCWRARPTAPPPLTTPAPNRVVVCA